MKMEEHLLKDKNALIRIKIEKDLLKTKFIHLTGDIAKNFDELAKVRFPYIDFSDEIKSAMNILRKAKL